MWLPQPKRRGVRHAYVEAACCPKWGRAADVQEHVRGAASHGVSKHAPRYLGNELAPWRCGSRLFAGRSLILLLEGPGVQHLQQG